MKGQGAKATTPHRGDLRTEEAQWRAYLIGLGPAVFMVAQILSKKGFFSHLRDCAEGVTEREALDFIGMTDYAGKQLLYAALCSGMLEVKADRYRLSKVGWFLDSDRQLRVNVDFMHQVNYRGFYHLEESLQEGRPAGLQTLGTWRTVYEGLGELPESVRESWLAFDHLYSDVSFDAALTLLQQRKEAVKGGRSPQRHFRLLDVGGNTGRWALRCVQRDPEVEVTVCDLPGQLTLLRQAVEGQFGSERIQGYAVDLLDASAALPDGPWDAVWMSQFLDCFSREEGANILARARSVMDAESRLYILEPLWDRQRYGVSSMCLSLMSLYFTAIANGNSGFFKSSDLLSLVAECGFEVVSEHDGLGVGHTLLELRKAEE